MADVDNKPFKFSEDYLDDRIVKAIVELGWKTPTLIQEHAVPLALEGKDILARACTGSGKTAAFAIPMLQKILDRKKATGTQSIRGLILAPTKELSSQICDHIKKLCLFCSREVRCIDLSMQAEVEAQKPILATLPDIVVGTPNRLLTHLEAKNILLNASLEFLVIDEADLVLSFGYEDEMKQLVEFLPVNVQSFLTSATLDDNVTLLKKMFLHNPVTLKLQDTSLPSSNQLFQYHIICEEEDKFVLIYALLKLRLVKGRSIIFVNTVDRCYRLKLFLEQFAIHSCILNSEMPSNSRCHIVQQFNEGKYDIIISADESFGQKDDTKNGKKIAPSKRQRDPESGISRGIDFHQVENVVNFDFARTFDEYVHRVGRTARGSNEGTALSFITKKDQKAFKRISALMLKQTNEEVFKPYQFRMDELDGFKYRARDAFKAVTSSIVKEARLKDIKEEIMKSEKLRSYFAKNPRDLSVLDHNQELHLIRSQPHLQHVPDYIVNMEPRINYLDFNDMQDCFVCGLSNGLRVYTTDPLVEKINLDSKVIGSVKIATILRRSNLVAVVPSNDTIVYHSDRSTNLRLKVGTKYSSDTLLIWDDLKRRFVLEIKMDNSILAVKMSVKRLSIVTSNQITVFSFPGKPQKIFSAETRNNPKGLCDVSVEPTMEYLVFPAFKLGAIQIMDLQEISPMCSTSPLTVIAHQNEITCLAINRSGSIMATASTRGTLIRLFDVQKRDLIAQLRRGSDPATFYCIKFSPDSSYLCASSDKGTIHIFCVEDLSLNKRSALQNIPVLGGSYVDSQWALAKCPGIVESPCICGFSSNQSVIAIYEDGSFCKYVFTKNGTCRREAFERFLFVTDDQHFWDSYKLY